MTLKKKLIYVIYIYLIVIFFHAFIAKNTLFITVFCTLQYINNEIKIIFVLMIFYFSKLLAFLILKASLQNLIYHYENYIELFKLKI